MGGWRPPEASVPGKATVAANPSALPAARQVTAIGRNIFVPGRRLCYRGQTRPTPV
jgi:hypothetical protein